jgi:hypothetical protein
MDNLYSQEDINQIINQVWVQIRELRSTLQLITTTVEYLARQNGVDLEE